MERKLTKKDWQEHVEKAKGHPQGINAYCREQGFGNSTLHYWKQKLSTPRPSPAKVFAAVEITRPAECRAKLPDPKWLAEFLLSLAAGAR